jgi:diguanylate cyclase (GGDEF)-like protein/PAS domain S-box-containing protein
MRISLGGLEMTEKSKEKDKIANISEKYIISALMDYCTDSIYFKDLQSRFILANKALLKKLGMKNMSELIGKTDEDLFTEEHAKEAYAIEQKIIETGIPVVDIEEKETWYKKGIRWVSTTKMPFYDKEGNIMGTFGISRDITDRKKAEEKVQYLYCHDQLTGLYNRTFFDEELNRIDTDRQLPITIVMGDVDKLKLINDTYGHLKGDILLKTIADIFKKCFRKEDIVSRWGGDEFIAILPKTEKKDALKIIKRIQSSCKKRNVNGVPVSISLGTSTKESSSKNILDILKEAEDKMYEKKIKSRKSIISLYSKDDKNTK